MRADTLNYPASIGVIAALLRRRTFREQCWQLVTEAFATTSGHNEDAVGAGKCSIHGGELMVPESGEAELGGEFVL